MTWSRFDDAAPKSPKAVNAGNEAWALWAAAVMYCNRQLTDGFVSLAALATDCLPVPIPLAKAKKLAEKLCQAKARPEGKGLFEIAGPSLFKVHDFEDWNLLKAEVESKRRADRNRKRKGPDSGGESGGTPPRNPSGIPDGNPNGIPSGTQTESERNPGGFQTPAGARAGDPSPSIPIPAHNTRRGSGDLVPCPADLTLSDAQIGTLETSLVPRWAIPILTGRFIANHQTDPEDLRSRSVWLKCLSQAISGWWFNPKTRPQQVEDLKPSNDETGGYGKAAEWR